MNCTHSILLTDFINQHSLITREAAQALIEYAGDTACRQIELDFTGVDFISRSFADQFHKEKMRLWQTASKEVEIVNACDNVLEMLKAVSKTQDEPKDNSRQFAYIDVGSRPAVKRFLLSI